MRGSGPRNHVKAMSQSTFNNFHIQLEMKSQQSLMSVSKGQVEDFKGISLIKNTSRG